MTNAELIKALWNCSSPTVGSCTDCPYYKGVSCKWQMMEDAADALEAAEKRIKELESQAAFFDAEKLNYQENIVYRDELIKELEAQLPKEGEWKNILQNGDGTSDYQCSACLGIIMNIPDDDEHPLCSFCPNCGAKMKNVTDCHTLEEGEQ